jgi:4-diphosphocytidyl-2-C-methyl-D-erythritol kinase
MTDDTFRRAKLRAFAKINLVLDLLHLREDGYTEIATVFQSVDLADELVVTWFPAGAGIVLETVGEPPCAPEENLALRAACAFVERYGLRGGVRITLEKRIPSGAGLGGGSTDAAAVLAGLAALSGCARAEDLALLGAGLGADVPFFLTGGLALGTGRGDLVEPLPDLPEWPVVIARAGRSLATADVYRAARAELTARHDAPNISRFLRHLRETPGELPPLGNDLLPVAARLEPRIPGLLDDLRSFGGRAGMTGSGSTVFGFFRDESAAREAGKRLTDTGAATFVEVVRTLRRSDAVAAG